MKKLGIIAAKGDLSKKLIEYAKDEFEIFVVAIYGETAPNLLENIDHVWINIGEIGRAVDAMKSASVKNIIFVGSLSKPDILKLKVDSMGAKLLAKIAKDKIFGDNKLLSSITKFLEDQDFKVLGVDEILKDLVVPAKEFTTVLPNEQDRADIELAIKVVKALGALDVGQGAIVENGIVIGVEALEGTDELISRCSILKRSKSCGGVLVKLSKPGQELRIDLPTIGINTVKNIYKAGFKGIVIEANRAIFLDQKEVIAYANEHKLYICSVLT